MHSLTQVIAERAKRIKASRSFMDFVTYTMPSYQVNWHHELLAEALQDFAIGKIKKLMVFMPPQHGKSELVSRRLPAYLLGINPKLKIVGCSYSAELARSFNRDVQRIIDDPLYANVFPDTSLNKSSLKSSEKGSFLRNADIFEVVKHKGFYKSVGLGGSLTGTPVDIGVIDDPVKDAIEADSPTYRARAWDWFINVFMSRMHNDSQVLVTQTRWHEDDLSGRILDRMNKAQDWKVISLPAICDGRSPDVDPRQVGEALWQDKHSKERLLEVKEVNPRAFHALYQQDPKPFEGGLVFNNWQIGECEGKAKVAYGLDFGFSPDPSALIKVSIQGDTMYVEEMFYRQKMTPDNIRDAVKSIVPRGTPVFCDHRTDLIQMLFNAGINAQLAKKDIDAGIKTLLNYRIFVHPDSQNLQKELKYYRFKEDKDGNPIGGKYTEVLNHAIDAWRYGGMGLAYKKTRRMKTIATGI